MAGAGIDVEMAVATVGRACRAVLEELGRWRGNELMVLSKAWSTAGSLSMAQVPTTDYGRCVMLVIVGGEARVSYVNGWPEDAFP